MGGPRKGKTTRLAGHSLVGEGAPHNDLGVRLRGEYSYGHEKTPGGRGQCSCGALSDVVTTRAARKRWHAEHKAEIKAQG